MIHHIRRSVLDKLATAESMRYGELKPHELDGNVFTYHLKGLMVDDLIKKSDEGEYSLTRLGRNYIVHRYENAAESAHSIFLIVLKRGDEYLLRRRDVQPLMGYAGFIHGEPEAGSSIIQTARKRLFDKTGLTNVALSVAGTALISQYQNEELHSFSHAVILFGDTESDIEIEKDATGHNFWSTLSEVDNLLPSCNDIVKMIENKQVWFEHSYDLNEL